MYYTCFRHINQYNFLLFKKFVHIDFQKWVCYYYINRSNIRSGILHDSINGGALTEVTFYILLSLFEPRHGYAIMSFVSTCSNGRLVLGAGTLYGALNSLEEKGWIAQCSVVGSRKKEYLITDLGKEVAKKELARIIELSQIAYSIIGGVK